MLVHVCKLYDAEALTCMKGRMKRSVQQMPFKEEDTMARIRKSSEMNRLADLSKRSTSINAVYGEGVQ